MRETVARKLAHWSRDVDWSDLPCDLRHLTRLRILDSLGLILAAVHTPQGHSTRTFLQKQGGPAESTVIGMDRRVPTCWAAFYHAILAHSHDFDDTFLESVIHPGSVIVPVALAAGEESGASGKEIILAIAIGYEVAARLGSVTERKLHARGFHATGVIGPLAAAVCAARLISLSVKKTTHALGLAGSMSSGLLEFLSDGTWTKWFHCGWAAHGGIVAAQLGAAGFSGPGTVVEGVQGVYRAFLGRGPLGIDETTANLGTEWRGGHAHFKPYPCAHVIQPYIDAILRMRSEHKLRAAEIRHVHCVIAPWCVPLVCEPRDERLRPRTSLQAIASLPYLVSAALVAGEVTIETVTTPGRQDAAVYELAKRVHHIVGQDSGAGFEGRLEIQTIDGRELAVSTVLAQPDEAIIRAKFRQNAARSWDEDEIDRLEHAVLDDPLDAARLFSLLSSR